MREVDEAAARVLRAMRALDAHRHAAAPTIEREYQRALEAYFEASERALGRDPQRDDATMAPLAKTSAPPVAAPADDDADPAAEELRRARAAIAEHYAAARRAIRLARAYRAEPRTSGRRERECLEAVSRHRDAVHRLRMQARRSGEQLALPGLAKTRPTAAAPQRTAKSG